MDLIAEIAKALKVRRPSPDSTATQLEEASARTREVIAESEQLIEQSEQLLVRPEVLGGR